ncbi:MAG: RNA pseudouridine synthase [Treponema sp.]|jgi:RluA family pseudouridine synthase|nr:RNA pseudouridine synthase [Treponema sp.]
MKKSPFTVIYEDSRLIAVNKASGIAAGGERWDPGAPRLDRLILQNSADPALPDSPRAQAPLFTVHRIDKETSGLVIFARDKANQRLLAAAFEKRRVEKTYTAVIHGRPSWPGGETFCDLPLVPEGNKKHMTIVDRYRGKPSLTRFTLILSRGNYSVVEARPETGRTHQIRVHLAALGHSIVCDPLYGKNSRGGGDGGVYLSSFKRNWRGDALEERPLLSRLGLHAARLVLPPGSFGAEKEDGNGGADPPLILEAPLPRDMAALFRQMERGA